jgi:hypothetical protein
MLRNLYRAPVHLVLLAEEVAAIMENVADYVAVGRRTAALRGYSAMQLCRNLKRLPQSSGEPIREPVLPFHLWLLDSQRVIICRLVALPTTSGQEAKWRLAFQQLSCYSPRSIP